MGQMSLVNIRRASWFLSAHRMLYASIASALIAISPAQAATALGAYNVKIDETSISGISSGAFMAVQFAVAHSALITGVGAIAGGPYYCAKDDLDIAYRGCMVGYPSYPTAAPLVSIVQSQAANGDIDPTSNLAKQKVWLFHGYNDGVVKQGVTDVLMAFYSDFTSGSNLFYKNNLPAAHSQVTDSWGQACSQTGGEFINNCGYDAAGQILQHLYGTLNARNTGTLTGTVQPFDQSAFYNGDIASIGMSSRGYVYVPASCAAGQPCRVHIALHGCLQNADTIGSDYYSHAGYNAWADTNNLIVLYPQTIATSTVPLNPNGCWDWWGYTDANYAKRSGAQIGVLAAMLQRLAGAYSGWADTPTGTFGAPGDVTAGDSSATQIELHWRPVAQASGYDVYRAACSTCAFSKLDATPVSGASFADSNLSPLTTYFYRVRSVDSTGNESADSPTVSFATAALPSVCDPYYRTNYDHWYESRAYTDLANVDIYAYGSNAWLGYTGPASTIVQTMLRRTGTNYYVVGPCQ